MPGLCIRRTRRGTSADRESFSESLDGLRHFSDYGGIVAVECDSLLVGYTGYPSYPVTTSEDDRYHVVLEGELYDRANPIAAVRDVAPDLFPGGDLGAVARWLRSVDGEFVCCVLDTETGTLAVLNDVFGRLPLYYRRDDEGVLVGREAGFVLDAGPSVGFDRLGIAESLLVGYTLGDRTLWSDVRKLPPAGLLRIDRSGDLTARRLHEFDFGDPAHADRSVEENAAALASLFERACERRGGVSATNVVSLSGGHDSRAVAAGFHAGATPFTTATFERADGAADADVRIAADVAAALGVDWKRYELAPIETAEMDALLDFKRGMNHLGMAFILEFFDALLEQHGRDTTYVTGDGGDKTLPDLSPAKPLDGLDDLVDYTVAKNDVFSLPDVARITGVARSTVVDEVRSLLRSYPEDHTAAKYVHFLTHERGFNWLFEGEDRNRYYCWSTTPFYATDVFTYAMNVPADQKAGNDLYREFLRALWPPAIEFPDADFGTPMTSVRYPLVQRVQSLLARYPALEDVARIVYRGELTYEYPRTVESAMRDQLAADGSVERVLSTAAVEDVLDSPLRYGRQELFNLFTITSVIDEQASGRDPVDDASRVATS